MEKRDATLTMRIPQRLKESLENQAAAKRTSVGNVANAILTAAFRSHK